MKNKKAPGEDQIIAEFIKALPGNKFRPIKEVINDIWKNARNPEG